MAVKAWSALEPEVFAMVINKVYHDPTRRIGGALARFNKLEGRISHMLRTQLWETATSDIKKLFVMSTDY